MAMLNNQMVLVVYRIPFCSKPHIWTFSLPVDKERHADRTSGPLAKLRGYPSPKVASWWLIHLVVNHTGWLPLPS